jgi:hypothetical protein
VFLVEKMNQDVRAFENGPGHGQGVRSIFLLSELNFPGHPHDARKLLCLHCVCFFCAFPKRKKGKKESSENAAVGWLARQMTRNKLKTSCRPEDAFNLCRKRFGRVLAATLLCFLSLSFFFLGMRLSHSAAIRFADCT